MLNQLLLPNKFKIVGWCLLIPPAILYALLGLNIIHFNIETYMFAAVDVAIFGGAKFFSVAYEDVTFTVIGIIALAGAMMVGFSKEKEEDEFIAKLRLSSLLWAVWVNYLLLFLAFIFIYEWAFFTVIVYNMYTVLIIFIARFNYLLFRNRSAVANEK